MSEVGRPGPVHVVYQMGKVGSSTAYESLRRAVAPTPVHKVHYLSDEGLARAEEFYRGLRVEVPLPHAAATRELRAALGRRDLCWKVVCLVREPIARDVSAYVQMVDVLHPELARDDPRSLRRVARAAAAQFLTFEESRSYTCTWFDVELRRVFGLDVYARPFPHGDGYLRFRRADLDLLLLRLEDFDRCGRQALSEFTGRDVPLVRHSSRRPEKLQAVYVEDVYSRILARVRVPESACERVYASRFARHFYTTAEIAAFTAKWSGAGRPERGPR